ncbi:hypothetical protein B484DRAFT_463 [Ochromonadaceae sp. CCMP2298]|nr:hypothetical protein B484DRAFT_463 [Ochromonadaceae sp. CCMP2298]
MAALGRRLHQEQDGREGGEDTLLGQESISQDSLLQSLAPALLLAAQLRDLSSADLPLALALLLDGAGGCLASLLSPFPPSLPLSAPPPGCAKADVETKEDVRAVGPALCARLCAVFLVSAAAHLGGSRGPPALLQLLHSTQGVGVVMEMGQGQGMGQGVGQGRGEREGGEEGVGVGMGADPALRLLYVHVCLLLLQSAPETGWPMQLEQLSVRGVRQRGLLQVRLLLELVSLDAQLCAKEARDAQWAAENVQIFLMHVLEACPASLRVERALLRGMADTDTLAQLYMRRGKSGRGGRDIGGSNRGSGRAGGGEWADGAGGQEWGEAPLSETRSRLLTAQLLASFQGGTAGLESAGGGGGGAGGGGDWGVDALLLALLNPALTHPRPSVSSSTSTSIGPSTSPTVGAGAGGRWQRLSVLNRLTALPLTHILTHPHDSAPAPCTSEMAAVAEGARRLLQWDRGLLWRLRTHSLSHTQSQFQCRWEGAGAGGGSGCFHLIFCAPEVLLCGDRQGPGWGLEGGGDAAGAGSMGQQEVPLYLSPVSAPQLDCLLTELCAAHGHGCGGQGWAQGQSQSLGQSAGAASGLPGVPTITSTPALVLSAPCLNLLEASFSLLHVTAMLGVGEWGAGGSGGGEGWVGVVRRFRHLLMPPVLAAALRWHLLRMAEAGVALAEAEAGAGSGYGAGSSSTASTTFGGYAAYAAAAAHLLDEAMPGEEDGVREMQGVQAEAEAGAAREEGVEKEAWVELDLALLLRGVFDAPLTQALLLFAALDPPRFSDCVSKTLGGLLRRVEKTIVWGAGNAAAASAASAAVGRDVGAASVSSEWVHLLALTVPLWLVASEVRGGTDARAHTYSQPQQHWLSQKQGGIGCSAVQASVRAVTSCAHRHAQIHTQTQRHTQTAILSRHAQGSSSEQTPLILSLSLPLPLPLGLSVFVCVDGHNHQQQHTHHLQQQQRSGFLLGSAAFSSLLLRGLCPSLDGDGCRGGDCSGVGVGAGLLVQVRGALREAGEWGLGGLPGAGQDLYLRLSHLLQMQLRARDRGGGRGGEQGFILTPLAPPTDAAESQGQGRWQRRGAGRRQWSQRHTPGASAGAAATRACGLERAGTGAGTGTDADADADAGAGRHVCVSADGAAAFPKRRHQAGQYGKGQGGWGGGGGGDKCYVYRYGGGR